MPDPGAPDACRRGWLGRLSRASLLGLLGLVPLLTGLVGTCPIYTLLGVSTCGTKPSSAGEAHG